MTQVDFYILNRASDTELLRLASRIAEKAVEQGQKVHLNADDTEQARRLDEVLWTYSQSSFLPHRIVAAAHDGDVGDPIEPVLIGAGVEIETGPWDVLVNLAAEVPPFFSRYGRVAELVDADDGRRDHGRTRYRYYRDRGYELKTHNLTA